MKHIFLKTALAALLIGGVATSCINDLNISSIDPQSSSSYEDMELLAKVYSTLGLTGQKGPAGSGDISSDEGESGFTVLHSICRNSVLMNVFGLGRLTPIFLKSPISTGRLHLLVCNGHSNVWHLM